MTPENGLFNLVCRQCTIEVSKWYVFKQQILRSFEIGKWLLEKRSRTINEKGSDCSSQHSTTVQENVNHLETLLEEHVIDVADRQIESAQSNECSETVLQHISVNTVTSTLPEVVDTNENKHRKQTKSLEDLLCKVCKKQCKSSNSFNRHSKTHDDTRPFICSKCDKPFKTSQVLAEHMKRHYDDRRHKCEVCGMKYYAKASLNDHMRSHTGERPFKCESCGKSFSTRAILRQHTAVRRAMLRKVGF